MRRDGEVLAFEDRFGEEVFKVWAVTDWTGWSGKREPGERYYTASIGLTAWRRKEGPVHESGPERAFRLCAKADETYLEKLRRLVPRGSTVCLRVRRAGELLLAVEQPEVDRDPALRWFRTCRRPPTYEDGRLGIFRLNENTRWYEKTIPWNGGRVRYGFADESKSMIQRSLSTIHALMEDPEGWEARIRSFAAERLLSLKNSRWLGKGEPEIAVQAFAERLVVNGINTASRGRFIFWFGDGDLFWGHTVKVSGTLKAGPQRATVEG